MFTLLDLLITVILAVVDRFTGLFSEPAGIRVLSGVFSLTNFIPGLAVGIRHLHDTGRNGWWILIVVAPCLGGIAFLMFMRLDRHLGDNEFGSNPKAQLA